MTEHTPEQPDDTADQGDIEAVFEPTDEHPPAPYPYTGDVVQDPEGSDER